MDPLFEFALAVKAIQRELERASNEAMPWSLFVYRLSAGAATQIGLRRARRAGFVPRSA